MKKSTLIMLGIVSLIAGGCILLLAAFGLWIVLRMFGVRLFLMLMEGTL